LPKNQSVFEQESPRDRCAISNAQDDVRDEVAVNRVRVHDARDAIHEGYDIEVLSLFRIVVVRGVVRVELVATRKRQALDEVGSLIHLRGIR
jgi:hypothetical protein